MKYTIIIVRKIKILYYNWYKNQGLIIQKHEKHELSPKFHEESQINKNGATFPSF